VVLVVLLLGAGQPAVLLLLLVLVLQGWLVWPPLLLLLLLLRCRRHCTGWRALPAPACCTRCWRHQMQLLQFKPLLLPLSIQCHHLALLLFCLPLLF